MGVPSPSNPLWEGVLAVLTEREFRTSGRVYDRRGLIARVDSLGGPVMRLLHWGRLAKLGRIPRSDEGEAIDAVGGIDTYGAPTVEVFMVSHRWLRPSVDPTRSHPDDPQDRKARAITEFSNWRRQWVLHRHGFLPEIYYWIDYACMDQDNTAGAVPLLPLWVACCERFLRVETEDYDERAWCRVEPLLSHAFSFADHHVSIGLDFRCRWPETGVKNRRPLLDPRGGKLTDPDDMRLIIPMVEVAEQDRSGGNSWPSGAEVQCYSL